MATKKRKGKKKSHVMDGLCGSNRGYLSGCKLFYLVYVLNREAFFTILKMAILSAGDFETATLLTGP